MDWSDEMRQPNVVVFFTDQQRADSTGAHGNPLELTPNFDRMAQRGTHLFHAFTPQPVCGPARACLQTGQYATTINCWRNGLALPGNVPSLATLFRKGGYRTGYIGKWHLAGPGKDGQECIGPVPSELRGGYEDWLASNVLEMTSEAYQTTMYDNECQPVQLPGYRVDALTDAAIRYVDTHQRDPFFLFVSYLEPHFQNHIDDYPAPDGYRERYTGRWVPPDLAALGGSTHAHLGGYWGMVKRLDEALGRLFDALKSLALADDTIVLFTSDHGCHFKTRNAEYKRSCHDSSLRVPTALIGSCFTGGGRVEQMTSLVDLPPTLLDAAGLPVPQTMQGRSLLPLLRGERLKWPEEVFVQISESQVGRAVRTRRWKYAVVAPDKNGFCDSAANRYQEDCLYDLESDPHELTNLIGLESHREVTAVMRERLLCRMVAAGETKPSIELAVSRPAGQRRVAAWEARA